jgi:two-component system, cell cycle sensor histidine kinase and response regulator CckA
MTEGRKILYLDDDDLLRKATSRFLGKVGYEVESARDGLDVVERYQKADQSGRPFDLVILDLSVPGGMGGEETLRKLREYDPGVKAIVTSGYPENPVMLDFENRGFTGVMAKPYSVQDLSRTVRSVLNR